MDTSKF